MLIHLHRAKPEILLLNAKGRIMPFYFLVQYIFKNEGRLGGAVGSRSDSWFKLRL